MNTSQLTFISKITEELNEIENLVKRAYMGWERAKNTNDDLYLDSVSLNLHAIYSGFEKIFELISKNIDKSMPSGESWHMELLKQMETEIQQVRPPVITKQTFDLLNEYRGFRHIVRNVYTYNISYKKLTPLIDDLQVTFDNVKTEIHQFIKLLE